MIKTVIAVALPVILTGIILFAFGQRFVGPSIPSGPVEIKYWGFDDESSVRLQIEEFEKLNPNTKVAYTKQSITNYRTRVQTQIREGVGPDVFKIHSSWTTMFIEDLNSSPAEIFSAADYQNKFFPVAAESFIVGNKIYGVPDIIDGLALYYNEDILASAGVIEPKNWQEFADAAAKMTVRDSNGQIKTAGAALGATTNIDFWPQILGLLLLQQPGVDLTRPASDKVGEVLTFYTNFVIDPRKKTWDINLPSSTSMFAQGNLAFYFAPSSEVPRLIATNPNLRFKIIQVPQLPGKQVSWGSFWGSGVSAKTKYSKQAWEFAKFLSEKEQEKQKTKLKDPLFAPFITQGPYYKSWYLNPETSDAGINDEMIKVWGEALNIVLAGQTSTTAVSNLDIKVKEVLAKYNITTGQ